MMALKTNYKDDIFEGNRKYSLINNADGTVSLEDATKYTQIGDVFGATDVNNIGIDVNGKMTKSVYDPNNKACDIFAYADAIDNKITNLETAEITSTGITSLPSTAQKAPFNELVLYGNTIDGQSVGEVTVDVVGKNLFDGKLELGNHSSITGEKITGTNIIRSVNAIRLCKGKTYDFKRFDTNAGFTFYFYELNGTFIKYVGWASAAKWFPQSDFVGFNRDVLCRISLMNTSDTTINCMFSETDATTFVPYEVTSTVTPPIGNSVPSIKDTFDCVSGVKTQNINPYVFTNNEPLSIEGGDNGVVARYSLSLSKFSDALLPPLGVYDFNTIHIGGVSRSSYDDRGKATSIGTYYTYDARIIFVFVTGTTLAQAQTALAGTKMWYQLAQPTITQYDTEVLLSQPNGTIIPSTDGIYPTMKIKYPNNTKGVIEANTQAIVNLDRDIDTLREFTTSNLVEIGGEVDQINNTLPSLAKKSTQSTVTLLASNWVGTSAPYSYTLALAGVTATNNVELNVPGTITMTQYEIMSNAKIASGTQSVGSIVLKAYGDKPTVDLPIQVTIRGDM